MCHVWQYGTLYEDWDKDLAIGKLLGGEETNKAGVSVVEALHCVEKVSHKSGTSSHCLLSLNNQT